MIVGVSDEGMATLKKWVDARGVTYPIVNAPKALASYKIGAYPTAYVVDERGMLVGSDKLTAADIEERLKSVTWQPSFGDTPLLKTLTGLWQAGKVGEVHRKLEQAEAEADLGDEDKAGIALVRTQFDKLQARTQKEIDEADLGPDYVAIEDRLRDIEKQWSGLPLSAAAKKAAADLRKDQRIKQELDAGKKLRELVARAGGDMKKLAPGLQALIKRYPDTFAASQARDLLKSR